MTSKQATWKWIEEHQIAFEHMKKSISRETLLVYLNISDLCILQTDASKIQLGAVISQDNKPIAFYSRRPNAAQVNYTTTEREPLSIVKTLRKPRNNLVGQQIKLSTDHKNLTYKSFNTERVMRWRLILEELSPKSIYDKGSKNIVVDTFSCLDKIDNVNSNDNNKVEATLECLSENLPKIKKMFFTPLVSKLL